MGNEAAASPEGVPRTIRLSPSPAVALAQAPRFGLNLGGASTWGAEQLSANVLKNPGFEAPIDRSTGRPLAMSKLIPDRGAWMDFETRKSDYIILKFNRKRTVPITVLLNPVITPLDGQMVEDWEGCLSVPGLRGKVPRHARIRYRGWDAKGELIEREAEGFHARVVQHECDHLIGRLYPTRMTDLSKLGFTSVLFPDLDPQGDE